ncbi:MAG: B12-binding domain-containing radical SAM protein [Armatimonadetes bacterium]|nr:B12-binding domain-containing radical SAM protein [Armatimonadota bacterium]
MAGWKAHLPPLGLVTVAALCPNHWELRLIDEAVEPLTDEALAWADLVMVSAMEVQGERVKAILKRARAMGRRTIIGGPYASSYFDELLPLADHVVAGEPDEVFGEIARELEEGTARPLYQIRDKPDISVTPVPRFDLLKRECYAMMAIQFSRGCPFQCEFCDIITIYGRKPRTKSPAQVLIELDTLLRLGWRREIFMVDDNFIGNHKKASDLLEELEKWQERRGYPVSFFTEASINLASKPELLDAMVRANFLYVFIGIETPSRESLAETHKFQNLHGSLLDSVRLIQNRGLWVMAGFIVGFDSDDETIFERQLQFIEEAAIPWATVGILQAPRQTALYTRLEKEGRLRPRSRLGLGNFELPNFETRMPLPVLVKGYRDLLARLYEPGAFFKRVLRSMEPWRPRKPQAPPPIPLSSKVTVVIGSLWGQGVKSPYRFWFWRALLTVLLRWGLDSVKVFMAFNAISSAEHLVAYAATQVERADRLLRSPDGMPAPSLERTQGSLTA